MSDTDLSAAEKLAVALDLFESGVEVMRQNLRRSHPSEKAGQIESRLRRWLRTRPGAEHGDGVGRPLGPREPL